MHCVAFYLLLPRGCYCYYHYHYYYYYPATSRRCIVSAVMQLLLQAFLPFQKLHWHVLILSVKLAHRLAARSQLHSFDMQCNAIAIDDSLFVNVVVVVVAIIILACFVGVEEVLITITITLFAFVLPTKYGTLLPLDCPLLLPCPHRSLHRSIAPNILPYHFPIVVVVLVVLVGSGMEFESNQSWRICIRRPMPCATTLQFGSCGMALVVLLFRPS